MTLNMMIVNAGGIWQCSDLRLVDTSTGKIKTIDDLSIKHVGLRCPDGIALIAYAGIGRLRNVTISDWIRETLRGEQRTVAESLHALTENATRDLGPLLQKKLIPHMFSVGAFVNSMPWAVQVRNFECPTPFTRGEPQSIFRLVGSRVEGRGFMSIFGGAYPDERDCTELERVASKIPRRPKDFQNLLASINLRTSNTVAGRRVISPHCLTTFSPPSGDGLESMLHGVPNSPDNLVPPFLLFGIDLTDMEVASMQMLSAIRQGSAVANPDPAFGERAVTPKNRLRRP